MSDSKEHKFKVGDVVKLINSQSLYSCSNIKGEVRLEPNKDYPVVTVNELNNFVEVMKENGEIEGCYGWRFAHAEPTTTAESLRNSILSLQQERVSLQEQIEQNIAQEKELTEQLKGLGFLLVEREEQAIAVVEEKKSVLYAEDIDEDMTDPYNWKVGDILEQTHYEFKDRFTRITEIGEDEWYTQDNDGDDSHSYCDYENMKEHFTFHSRPVVN